MSEVGVGSPQWMKAMYANFGKPGQVPPGGSLPQMEPGYYRSATSVGPTAQRIPNMGAIGGALGIADLLAMIGQGITNENIARRETLTPTTIPGQTYISGGNPQATLPSIGDTARAEMIRNRMAQVGAEPYGLSQEELRGIPRKPKQKAKPYKQWVAPDFSSDPTAMAQREKLRQMLFDDALQQAQQSEEFY